jgi:hypothetical protein
MEVFNLADLKVKYSPKLLRFIWFSNFIAGCPIIKKSSSGSSTGSV